MKSPYSRQAAIAALAAFALARPASAQSPESPSLVFSTFGAYLGGSSLWRVPRQLATAPVDQMDTLDLSRVVVPGFAVGMTMTLFPSPHVGYTVEVAFLGATTESRCVVVTGFAADTAHRNQQACEYIHGRAIRTSLVALQGGLTWRVAYRGPVQPYFRVGGGAAFIGGSFVETSGRYAWQGQNVWQTYLGEAKHSEMTWVAAAAAGAMLEISPGYLIRFELRDAVMNVPVATGPGDPRSTEVIAPSGRRTVHLPMVGVAFDIALERRQGRRRY